MPDKLIIFDYSGTLSLGMSAFSHPDNLIHHLQSSGLFALGVESPALFWEIVNATWMKGSTTRLGYKKVMQERISGMFPGLAITRQPEIVAAVNNFVDAYLDYSHVDEHWRPILKELSENKTVQVIIATDHYAEATNLIIRFLGKWNIRAIPLAAGINSNFVVANSADIGMHKDQQQFWQVIKNALPVNYKRILLIDDFGQNEQKGDTYGDSKKINQRKRATIKVLCATFTADVESVSFVIKDEHVSGLIAETSAIIGQFLSSEKEGK